MAKKTSNVVYYTPNIPVQDIKDIINEKIEQIPAYEDTGVRYQGKYKKQVTQKEYSLKNQIPIRYAFTIWSGGASQNITRTANRKFFCTSIYVQIQAAAPFDKQLILYDGSYLTSTRALWARDTVAGTATYLDLYLTFPTPLEFRSSDNTIGLASSYSYGAASERVTIFLYGFEEEI